MELDSGADSVSSTPRSTSDNHQHTNTIRLMCSFGGKIIPRPHDNQLRYVGGDTRIVAIHRSSSFSSLVSKLSKLLPCTTTTTTSSCFVVKYQLPNEDLDSLITVSTDEDVENMIDEFDRLTLQSSTPRLRLFLFPASQDDEESDPIQNSNNISSLLDGSRNRESWFLDALNGGHLERGRSEASSIVSEVPDYLFGLDNNSDEPAPRIKYRAGLVEPAYGSDPNSPAVVASGSSPFDSASTAVPMPSLPPVKIKPENPVRDVNEPDPVQFTVGYSGGPVWNSNTNSNPTPSSPYPGHAMQAIPVYYVPAGPVPGPVRRNAHVQPVSGPVPGPTQGHFIQQYAPVAGPGQVPVPVIYQGSGPVYGPVRPVGGGDTYEMPMQGGPVQPVYYGPAKNSGPGMVTTYPGMVMPVKQDEPAGSEPK